jgi:hypothetical protein
MFQLAISGHRRYAPSFRVRTVAAGLLATEHQWYSFDINDKDQAGGGGWSQTFGGGITLVPGAKGNEMIGYQEMRENSSLALSGFDWTYSTILHVASEASSRTVRTGRGENTTYGTDPRAWMDVVIDGFGNVSVRVIAFDATAFSYFASGYFPVGVAGDRFFAALVWRESARTFSLYINAVHMATLTLTAPLYSAAALCAFLSQLSTAAFGEIVCRLDETCTWKGKAFSQAELDLLYNGGAYLSRTELVALAA